MRKHIFIIGLILGLAIIFSHTTAQETIIKTEKKISDLGADSLNIIGYMLYKREKFKEALAILDISLSKEEKNPQALDLKAAIYEQYGDYEQAKELYKKAISINQNDARAYYGLGEISKREKEYSLAVAYYKNAVLLDTTNDIACNNLANIYYRSLGDYKNALVYYQMAIERNENNDLTYYNRAHLYEYALQDYSKAESDLLKAIQINDKSDKAHYSLCLLYIRHILNRELGKKHYLKAMELNPELKTPDIEKYLGLK